MVAPKKGIASHDSESLPESGSPLDQFSNRSDVVRPE